jgi:hypothetical protein
MTTTTCRPHTTTRARAPASGTRSSRSGTGEHASFIALSLLHRLASFARVPCVASPRLATCLTPSPAPLHTHAHTSAPPARRDVDEEAAADAPWAQQEAYEAEQLKKALATTGARDRKAEAGEHARGGWVGGWWWWVVGASVCVCECGSGRRAGGCGARMRSLLHGTPPRVSLAHVPASGGPLEAKGAFQGTRGRESSPAAARLTPPASPLFPHHAEKYEFVFEDQVEFIVDQFLAGTAPVRGPPLLHPPAAHPAALPPRTAPRHARPAAPGGVALPPAVSHRPQGAKGNRRLPSATAPMGQKETAACRQPPPPGGERKPPPAVSHRPQGAKGNRRLAPDPLHRPTRGACCLVPRACVDRGGKQGGDCRA